MTEQYLLELIIGPLGGFVVTIVALVAMVRGKLVAPRYVLDNVETRNALLEKEAREQHEIIMEHTRLNAMLGAQVEGLRQDVAELTRANERLEREVAELRERLLAGR
jgi:predicted RNase H-like nuclease (RuvC/YqgF family)